MAASRRGLRDSAAKWSKPPRRATPATPFALRSEADSEAHRRLVLVEILRPLVERIAIFGFHEGMAADRELGAGAQADPVRLRIGDELAGRGREAVRFAVIGIAGL